MSESEIRFSLDIGTRSVIGLLTRTSDAGIEILACERIEHSSRAMLDGQIHNVPEVAEVIKDVKHRLEQICSPLNSAAVAAAGRALCTVKTCIEQEVTSLAPLQEEDIRRFELTAVQTAQKQLAQDKLVEDPTAYYCVGYSVVNYFLDNGIIANLEGQRGKSVGIELIATFLPRIVIESLQSALSLADLDIHSLTLEPIAAINVLIPSTMRHLNLALVDIGAGTSDIAITSKGTVIAFGMVPCAGDEITEAISNRYLLDFNIAEQVKRQLHEQTVTFADVLGMSYTKESQEIVAGIQTDILNLAETISEQISALNGRSPQAVLLIGGGSLTPGLASEIARLLDLPVERVGIREAKSMQGFLNLPGHLSGPDGITPLGITKTAHSQTLNFLQVTVNDALLRLFNFGGVTVADALLAAGLSIRNLQGRPGMGLSVTINGKLNFLSGTFGSPPSILLNGQPAGLDTALNNRDVLVVVKGTDGENASGTVADILPKTKSLSAVFNGRQISVNPVITVNGKPANLLAPIEDGMQITIQQPQKLCDLIKALNMPVASPGLQTYKFTVNGVAHTYTPNNTIKINGAPATLNSSVQDGDEIVFSAPVHTAPLVGDILDLDCADDKNLTVIVNGDPLTICLETVKVSMNGSVVSLSTPLVNSASITYEHTSQPSPIVSELLLRYEEEILSRTKAGHKLKLTLNGESASYAAPLKNGDRLDWSWESD